MLEKSGNFAHTPQKWRKFTSDMGFKKWVWQNGSIAPPIHFQQSAPRTAFHVQV